MGSNLRAIDQGVKYNGTGIEAEYLEEQLIYNDELGDCYINTFNYIYDSNNEKLYYDKDEENFFKYDEIKKEAVYIEDGDSIKVGSKNCKYKSLSVLWGNTTKTEYKKIYQVLNGIDKGKWYIDAYSDAKTGMAQADTDDITTKVDASIITDLGISCDLLANYSDINYYVEAYTFTNWVKQNLKDVNQQVYNEETKSYETISIENIFDINETNNPENDESIFVQHKKNLQKEAIKKDLDLAIYNYSRGTKSFNLPIPSYNDWETAISNISFVAFLQGIPCGLKTYNNYFISTSLGNKEFVEPSQLYYIGKDVDFHRIYCAHCSNTKYTAYRNVEFQVKEVETFDDDMGYDGTAYYYPHDRQNKIDAKTKRKIDDNNAETACYYCIVNKASYEETTDPKIIGQMTKAYTEAIARERYEQKGIVEQTVSSDTGIEILPSTPEPPRPAPTPSAPTTNIEPTRTPGPTEPPIQISEEETVVELDKLLWSKDYYWINDNSEEWITDYQFDQTSHPGVNGRLHFKYGEINSYINLNGNGVRDGSIIRIREPKNTSTNSVEIIGNNSYEGKGAVWAEAPGKNIREIKFNYNIQESYGFYDYGIMLNISENDEYLEGFLVTFNFSSRNVKKGMRVKFV